jgi:tetratricopeptide (TPR) repeat protein
MKPFLVAFTAAAVAAATAGILVSVLHDDAKPASAQADAPDGGSEISRRLDALDKQNADLAKSIDDLRMQLSTKDAPARVPMGEIDAAVARALEKSGAAKGGGDALAAAEAKKSADKAADAKAIFAELQGKNWEDAQAIWKKAADAGVLDELVAMYEKNAADHPNDAKAQVELGHAYIQKTMNVADGPGKGMWSMKADRAYDKALGLDDHNWEARFSKAVNYSFWPPALGKQRDAIAQFETLVQQQQGQPLQPQFAETHLWLGNMYSQIGQKDKALAAWQAGLAMFPDNEELQHQISLAQAH